MKMIIKKRQFKNLLCSIKINVLFLTIITSFSIFANEVQSNEKIINNNYCIAIRGNGELEPAHWGALAKTIETFGIPSGMAGGSSGSISTFLLESLMMNKTFKDEQNPNKKREILAFLIKSLKHFTEAKVSNPEFKTLFSILGILSNSNSKNEMLKKINDFVKNNNENSLFVGAKEKLTELFNVINKLIDSEIFYGPQVISLYNALKDFFDNNNGDGNLKISRITNEYEKLKETLKVFGSFNAKDDKSLFFRGGIVNFSALANAIGFVADFYSQEPFNENINTKFKQYINECKIQSSNVFLETNQSCINSLSQLIESYIDFRMQNDSNKNKIFNSIRIHHQIGSILPSLISTAVSIGKSANKLIDLKIKYDTNQNANFESLDLNPDEIRFGYWGQEQHLNRIQTFFNNSPNHELTSIDKSKRFLSLGQSTWNTALSLSPAEPGLSSMIEFNLNNSKVVSLGGWSDLHPVPVLKAMPDICKNVVYITRSGGDAVFGQGIAKKVLNFNFPNWEDLDGLSKDPKNLTQFYNNNGRQENKIKEYFNGLWSNMFNLANPKSSFTVSLKNSDAVVCSHWNDFNIKNGFSQMINDAYNSNIILNNSKMSILDHKNSIINTNDESNQNWKKEMTTLPDPNSHLTYPKYSGCYAYDDYISEYEESN